MIHIEKNNSDIRELNFYSLNESENRNAEEKVTPGAVIGTVSLASLLEIFSCGSIKPSELPEKLQELENIALIAIATKSPTANTANIGADNFTHNPAGIAELMAGVAELIKRAEEKESLLCVGEVVLELKRRVLSVAGKTEKNLGYKEFELLKYFMKFPGRVYTREELMHSVWGLSYLGKSRTVDMHIKLLRKKLGNASYMLQTVRSVGYKFVR
jgi:two-component system alkaline phosphatase synthesis response regulator PhoP